MDISLEQKKLEELLESTSTLSLVEEYELSYLGRNGKINELLKNMKDLPPDQRKDAGRAINSFKNEALNLFTKRKASIIEKQDATSNVDTTLPGTHIPMGTVHPITIAVNEITDLFEKIGFIRMSYPEVDWEYFAFEALNMPVTHAARDDFETTFLNGDSDKEYGKMVLTPHTSNGQIHEMVRLGKPPIRMINIGKCYRPNWDATHTPMFHQFEGLCVDKNINITNLKGTLDYFVKSYFGEHTEVRLRPHHFQFTEPSFEVDVTCTVCKGSALINGNKCKICKSGWLELGGTGMVHPNVLTFGKIDSTIYSGWAFGFGIERVIMMKYGIDDIRNYYSGDVRFLKLF
jgi:phenylalanyl-tRNA synthetase alpha chain